MPGNQKATVCQNAVHLLVDLQDALHVICLAMTLPEQAEHNDVVVRIQAPEMDDISNMMFVRASIFGHAFSDVDGLECATDNFMIIFCVPLHPYKQCPVLQ